MSYLVGILIIFVGLLLSIGLHELGHLLPAKKFGVRVPQYMVGFGPTIWSFTRGETEYGIKAIPLGGYVRLVGMYAPADPRKAQKPGRFAELISSARDASNEEILPGEEHRAFYNLSTPKKVIVMFGGPVVNLIIAFTLSIAIFSGFGVQQATTTLGTVSQCVLPADAAADAQCTETSTAAPAAQAGLQPGDKIVSWNGVAVDSWTELSDLIANSGGQTVPVTYVRDGVTVETNASPIVEKRPTYDADGVAIVDAEGNAVLADKGFMGFSASVERTPLSLGESVDQFGTQLAGTAKVIVSLPQRLVDVAKAAFGSEERDATSVVGIVGIGRFAGELASNDQVGGVAEVAVSLLSLIASLNLALFAFNMIPLPPLDGGHIATALYEGGRRQLAKVRGKANPGPADTARLLPLSYAMFLLFGAMGVLLIYADLVNPIKLFG